MKNLVFFIACLWATPALWAQVSGGPDGFGYTWQNTSSTAIDAPAYNWIDITSTGTLVAGLGDDNFVGPLSMGFNFRYYWSDFSQLYVGSNGYVSFQPYNISSTAIGFPTMPVVDPYNNLMAPMLCDLNFSGSGNPGEVYLWSNNVDSCIISYVSVPFWINSIAGYGGSNTFQVIYSGVDSSITFQYQQQLGSYDAAYNTVTNPVVVGIENLTGSVGLTVSNNTLPLASTAVKFYYPDSILLSVPDVSPIWVQNIDNGGFFVSQNGTAVTGQTTVANVGNVDITTGIGVGLEIFNAANIMVHTDALSLTGLAVGADTLLNFTAGYSPTVAGHYSYEVSTTNTADLNLTNDQTPIEMVVVDTSAIVSTLTYWGGTPGSATNVVSWTGGNTDDGIGIYIEPPFYPATIESVEAYLFTTGVAVGANSFEIRVYDDDAGPGQGTLLGSAFMPAATAATDSYNSVAMPTPIEITSGGFYVGWYMTGETVQLGLETVAPISRRSYEILFDTWSPYREVTNNEPMIRVKVRRNCTVANGIDLGADTTICSNTPLNLSAGAPTLNFLWSTGDTTSSIAVATPGTYYVDVSDGQGCTGTDTVVVDTLTAPSIQLPADVQTCAGDTILLDGGTGYASYLWSTGETTQTITVTTGATYSLTVGNANGCTDIDDIIVNFQPLPIMSLGPDQAICSGDDLNLTAQPGFSSYLWSTGETTSGITVDMAGTYWLQVSDALGCSVSDTLLVISDEPIPDLGTDQTICEGTTANLNAGNFPGYLWSTGETSAAIVVADSGVYSVTVVDANGCTGSDSVAIFVDPLPDPDFIYAAIGPLSYQFTNTTTNGNTYAWDFGDGSSGSTLENPTFTYLFAGMYTVQLIATNDCGADTTEITIANVGIDPALQSGIKVYPNPNGGQFTLEFTSITKEVVNIRLYNALGQEIKQELLRNIYPGYRHEWKVAGLPEGLYELQIESKSGTAVHRIQIRH